MSWKEKSGHLSRQRPKQIMTVLAKASSKLVLCSSLLVKGIHWLK
jgi:hypothetical protein